MTRQQPTTIAILGANTVVENALAVLLRGVGYDVRIIDAPLTGRIGNLLADVDLVLISPGLDAEHREESLASLRGGAGGMPVAVLQLSSVLEEALFPDEVAILPWPSGFGEVARVIESVLTPAAAPASPGSADAPH